MENIQNLIDHVNVCSSLIQIKQFMDKSSNESAIDLTKLIDNLVNEKQLLHHFFNDMRYIYMYEQQTNDIDAYLNEIQQRCSFLEYILFNSNIHLLDDQLTILWLFVTDGTAVRQFIIRQLSKWINCIDGKAAKNFFVTHLKPYIIDNIENYSIIFDICDFAENIILHIRRTNSWGHYFDHHLDTYISYTYSYKQLITKDAKLNTIPFTQYLIQQLQSNNKLSISISVFTLFANIMNDLDVKLCIPILTQGPPPLRLTTKVKQVLKTIFDKFATNEDNTMSHNDMKRYIIAMGAGTNSCSKVRIQGIFTQHGTLRVAYQDRLTLRGFLNFYRSACFDRLGHVWSDLNTCGYGCNLNKAEFTEGANKLTQTKLAKCIFSKNGKYFHTLLNQCFEKVVDDNDDTIRKNEILCDVIVKLPRSNALKQVISNFDKPLSTLFDIKEINICRMVYNILLCELIIFDDKNDKWKQEFVNEKKGFDILIQILCKFFYMKKINGNTETAVFALGFASLLNIMHSFAVNIPVHLFMNRLIKHMSYFRKDQLLQIMNEQQNNLLHLICLETTIACDLSMKLLKFITQLFCVGLCQIYAEPLVCGYCRKSKPPSDIIKLILLFFV